MVGIFWLWKSVSDMNWGLFFLRVGFSTIHCTFLMSILVKTNKNALQKKNSGKSKSFYYIHEFFSFPNTSPLSFLAAIILKETFAVFLDEILQ